MLTFFSFSFSRTAATNPQNSGRSFNAGNCSVMLVMVKYITAQGKEKKKNK